MKGRQETTFGTIFQPWPLRPLPEVAFFQEGPGLRKWQWTESGMKVINVTNIIGDGSVDVSNTARFISTDEFESKYKHFAVDPGDIVVASSGNTYGKVGRICHSHLPIMMNTSVIRFHPAKAETLDQGFLYAFLRSHLFKNQMESFVIGSAQPNFGPSHLKRMLIPLPDLLTQRKIAGVLSAYDDLIENNTRRIAILEEMAQAIYREWFVHFRYPGHENTPLVDSPLGKIPQGWRCEVLVDACVLTMGQSPSSDFYNEEGNGLPFHQGVTNFGDRYPTHAIYSTVTNRVAQNGDVLFSVRAPVGRLNIADTTLVIGRGVSAIRHRLGKQVFLFHQLREKFEKVDTMGGGTIFKSVTKEDVQKIHLITPPLKLIDEFENAVGSHFLQYHNLTKRNRILRKTRELLLPKLISGALDIEDIDIGEHDASEV